MKRMVTVLGVLILSVFVAQFAWAGGGVLVVDDDGSCVAETSYSDIRPIFEAALQYARLAPVADATSRGEYEIYEILTTTGDGPDVAKLDDYAAVIWFTGETCCTFPACLTPTDESNLAAYLDLGGRLFLSAQDYLQHYGDGALSPGTFPYDYLKVQACTLDVWQGTGYTATGPMDPGAITHEFVFELENPFGKGPGDLAVDKVVSQTAVKAQIADEFEIDDAVAGTGFTGVSYKEGAMPGEYISFFSTICFAALKDEAGTENTKGNLMMRIMSTFLGDYADYGDAPDPPYPSLWETYDSTYGLPNIGARHENSDGLFEWLGDNIDLEFNSWQVDNDLYDDGVSFNFPYTPGGVGSVDITIQVADWSAGRYNLPPMFDDMLHLHGWFDWNQDGDWDDAGENVFCSVDHNPFDEAWGQNTMMFNITFPVPVDALDGEMWTRFRLDYQDDYNWFQMPVSHGEVEDYLITLNGPVSIGLSSFYASPGDGQATLYWTTESEVNNLGFYLVRSEVGREGYVRVNQGLISGHGTSEAHHEYSYVDRGLVNGVTYTYKLVDVDLEGVRTTHGPISVTAAAQVPSDYALSQNYPNPFNALTTITYSIPEDSHVSVKVFNVLGAEVRALVDQHHKANTYQATWDGKDADGMSVASGVYFCTMEAGEFSQTTKMVFLK
jgi:hypothetical protein